MKKLFKVGIVGPESTGKSSLSVALANYFHTEFVPEIARVYLEELNERYQEKDLLEIANQQCKAEDRISFYTDKILICDTTLLVVKIWSEVKYNRCDEWILKEEAQREYDLFLLCNIDLEWEDDPQREHPDQREFLFNLYYNALKLKPTPFEIISGSGEERTASAKAAIKKYNPAL